VINTAFSKIHDRMAFVLPPERAEQWLGGSLTDAGKAMELLQPNPDDAIAFHRISTRVIFTGSAPASVTPVTRVRT